MLNHVLVPLDGSTLAHSAMDYALNLLGSDGTITLVTVLPYTEVPLYDLYPMMATTPHVDYSAQYHQEYERARTYLNHIADSLREKRPYTIHTHVDTGDPATVIVGAAESLGVDAIVMSTHGRSGFSRWLFGSVTQKVLAASRCPVFVVPSRPREHDEQPETETPQAALNS